MTDRSSQRGSALLIVLGFLSFMIISGVSFAIYMRIERQASSNYRHSVTARHLLNASLYRAIDEVDSELRLQRKNPENPSVLEIRKFPESSGDEWQGRVKVSALADEELNEKNAHVLSLEALSYLPPFLVNDVRRYAVFNEDEDSADPYKGAKWRTLKRTFDEETIGRYAYVCVNLSDMLDVNQCKAQVRDSSTNRVSVGHLFATDAQRIEFDTVVAKFGRFFSLQDYYASWWAHKDKKDKASSPFHAYLKDGNMTVFNNAAALEKVFCTDSIVKPEPTNGIACNIVLSQPFEDVLLNNPKPDITSLAFKTERGNKPFWRALQETVDGVTWNLTREQMMTALIKDYIDPDPVPTQLSMPCVEMVPMISQIVINRDIMKAQVFDKIIPSAGPGLPETRQYGVRLINQNTMSAGRFPLYVEVVWPFKYFELRSLPSFKVRGVWCFKIVKSSLNTHSPELLTGSYQFELDSADADLLSSSFSQTAIFANQDKCYRNVQLLFDAPTPAQNEVLLLKEDGSAVSSSFAPGDSIRVACTMWLQVVTTYNGVERVVDQVPCMADDPTLTRVPALALWKASTPKLYFQTDGVPVNTLASRVGQFIEYQANNSLECPDPRFNYNAINWIGSTAASGTTDEQMNQSTRDMLADGTGRDRDLFMSVSDTGVLQSPGELGYIIRPYNWDVSYGVTVDFAVQNKVSAMSASNRDKDAMFRTFRLYDHSSSLKKDDIYENFFCAEADGILKGARVNPLSDLPEVLEAAIWNTPIDYWFASTNTTAALKKDQTFNQSVMHFNNDITKWEAFRDAWADALDAVTPKVNKAWSLSISDYYGDWTYFRWYSDDAARRSIFSGFMLDNPLHEIDRKMLYSFSLESFSDRQQLFLFFLRAEATSPSFGSGPNSGMRSLAGGRAVALVWRDPYPRGYSKSNDKYINPAGVMVNKATGNNAWYPRNGLISPWDQYDYNSGNQTRYNGYHDTRILFFKQLDQ